MGIIWAVGLRGIRYSEGMTHPKIDIEVAGAAKLAVADLEGHRHLVIAMEVLVEAFAAVGGKHNVVSGSGAEQAGRKQQLSCCEEMHFAIDFY